MAASVRCKIAALFWSPLWPAVHHIIGVAMFGHAVNDAIDPNAMCKADDDSQYARPTAIAVKQLQGVYCLRGTVVAVSHK